jgi:hypothetical protein
LLQTQESEDLLCVVRELTESRNKLTSFRAIQGERMADLQHEYMRVSRVADLSCALSRENIAKAGQLTQRLNQVRLVNYLAIKIWQHVKIKLCRSISPNAPSPWKLLPLSRCLQPPQVGLKNKNKVKHQRPLEVGIKTTI